MIPEFQKAALGCISAGARYDRFWRKAAVHDQQHLVIDKHE
jgi:hypothetical protein